MRFTLVMNNFEVLFFSCNYSISGMRGFFGFVMKAGSCTD